MTDTHPSAAPIARPTIPEKIAAEHTFHLAEGTFRDYAYCSCGRWDQSDSDCTTTGNHHMLEEAETELRSRIAADIEAAMQPSGARTVAARIARGQVEVDR